VIRLTRQASQLRQHGSYSRAVEACNEALSLEPEHGGALLERSKTYFNYVITRWDALNDEARTKFIVWAGNDAHQCCKSYPHLIWPRLFLDQLNVYLAFIKSDPAGYAHVLSSVNDELANAEFTKESTPKELAFLYNLRAQANDLLGSFEDAEVDYGASIKLDPGESQWYSNRAKFWERRGMRDLAKVDRWTARSLRDGLLGLD
jgi:tetratricopeptide (TPR) repeat protein